MAGPAVSGDIGRKTDTWGSRFGFIMAAVGSSVGLGNFWRFPYTAGENGGGAFIVVYLLCVVAIGLPILMAEYAIGRRTGHSAIEAVQSLAKQDGRSQYWGIAGWVGTLTSFFILSFYVVISVWILSFTLQAIGGEFSGMDAAASAENFSHTISQTWTILGLMVVFIGVNVIVVGRGVHGGIERVASVLMPLFFVMLIGIVVFAAITGDFAKTAAFLFEPKWSDVSFKTFLEALGQAFFSIGVGVGLMITYGAYLTRDTHIPRSSMIVAGADTLVAMIAGFAIFPIVFQAGLDPAGGPGLFFVSMPVAFSAVPGGGVLAAVFFALALFAAFTSSISLLEVSVSWLEERHGVTRMGAALGLGFILLLIGAGYVFSIEYLDFMDFITGAILLPLGGLLLAIFAGWVVSGHVMREELGDGSMFRVWTIMMRWCVPLFVGVILVFGFFDKIQDAYGVQLPDILTLLLGPNTGA